MKATTIFLASAAVLAMGTQAQIKGQIASLDSADNYCFFLPPDRGGNIALSEDKAIAFCNKPNPRAPGAQIFPPGFVLSAHWATGPQWVQITGQIDPAKYDLHPCDYGGQYDIKAPVGATCAGYKYFVNVIEPEIGVYGMRCCQKFEDCDVYHSEYGVRRIYGKEYNFSGPRPDGMLELSKLCDKNGKLPPNVAWPPVNGGSSGTPSTPSTNGTNPAPSAGADGKTGGAANSTAIPSGVAPSSTSAAAAPQKTPESAQENKTSSASGKSIMMAGSAVLAAVVGLIVA